MTEPIFDPDYWAERMDRAHKLKKPHYSVFECGEDRWKRIEAKHKEILARHILFADTIIDIGCGYGRLIDLLPPTYQGRYLGVDHCQEFIDSAIADYGEYDTEFKCWDLRELSALTKHVPGKFFDWAVMISIRPMIKRESGEAWDAIEQQVRRVAKRLLYLEYDENCEGSVE